MLSPSKSDFAELMREVSSRQLAGTLTVEKIQAALATLKLSSVVELAREPALIGKFKGLIS